MSYPSILFYSFFYKISSLERDMPEAFDQQSAQSSSDCSSDHEMKIISPTAIEVDHKVLSENANSVDITPDLQPENSINSSGSPNAKSSTMRK